MIFGDGVFGKKLANGDYIAVSYVVSQGDAANNVTNFNFAGKLTSSRDSSTITSGISLITTNTPAFGGKKIESVV